MGPRGTLQVPLRGPAQPLAAVCSDACEAVPRKQCALTLVSSASASMRWRAPQTHPCQRLRRMSVRNEDQRLALLSLTFVVSAVAEVLVGCFVGWMVVWGGVGIQLGCWRVALPCLISVTGPSTSRCRCGWVGGTVGRHGWRPRASRDGFTACPANPPAPVPATQATSPAFDPCTGTRSARSAFPIPTPQRPQAIAPARCNGYHQRLSGLTMRILSVDMNAARDRLPGTAPCTQAAVTPRKTGLAGIHTACVPATGIQHDRSCTGQGAQRALCCFRNMFSRARPA